MSLILSTVIFYKGNNEPVPNWVGFLFIGSCLAMATFAFMMDKEK
jgi:hypothetical protein